MIELTMAVCTLASPYYCKDVHLTFEAQSVSITQCALFGQFEMAKWSGEHPNWHINKWQCGLAGQVAKI